MDFDLGDSAADDEPETKSESETETDSDAESTAEDTTPARDNGTESTPRRTLDPEPDYDPQTDPAFPYEQREMQQSIYVRPETWKTYQKLKKYVDVEATDRDYENVAGREIDDAALRAIAEVPPEEIAELLIEARETAET